MTLISLEKIKDCKIQKEDIAYESLEHLTSLEPKMTSFVLNKL